MTITPAGTVPWSGDATAATYGGHPDKANYHGQDIINPLTDVSAAQFARLCADVAANTRTATYCTLRLTTNDTSPAAPTVEALKQMDVGVLTAPYEGDNPPAGFPTCTRVSDGKVQIVWPSSPSDDFGVVSADALDLQHAHGEVFGYNDYAKVKPSRAAATGSTLSFEAVDSAGTPIQDVTMMIEVS